MPQAPTATACPQCGNNIPPGRRFCTNCGYSLGGAPAGAAPRQAAAPRTPRPAGSGFNASSLQPLQFGIIGGAALAAIGTLLGWVKVSGLGSATANAWKSDLVDDLAIGKLIKAGIPIDALIIVILGALALYLLIGPMLGMQVPAIPYAGVIVGALIVAVGAWNYLHIKDQIKGLDGVSIDIGLYLVIVGGAVAAVCAFLDQQQRARI
jgi:hypothetical protein